MKILGRVGLVVMLVALIAGCNQNANQPSFDKEKARNYANELYNRQLFKQSADEYINYLRNYNLSKEEQANISYTVGDIYFERLKDYENALAFYIRVKYLDPKEELRTQIDKKVVACLERLERPEDANQTLRESTSLEPDKIQKKRPGAVVARIGEREVTQGDIDFELNQLPPSVRQLYNSKEKKLEFLNQYLLTEVLYNSAKNMGLDNDPEVIEAAFQSKKSIMVQKYLQDKITNEVQIEPSDVELYYQAHKEKYAEKNDDGEVVREKSFQEVQRQVAQDLVMEKQQEVYQRTAERLMRAESVKIYDDKLK